MLSYFPLGVYLILLFFLFSLIHDVITPHLLLSHSKKSALHSGQFSICSQTLLRTGTTLSTFMVSPSFFTLAVSNLARIVSSFSSSFLKRLCPIVSSGLFSCSDIC
ncbi:hypothetical protein SPV3_ORF12 [Sulfolobus polyhedral virus 3]|nr:hypothetical protein SPV3_ORF12 [Sulfolobus polyhedral virus 3]